MKKFVLIIAGIASIALSVVCFDKPRGMYVSEKYYGGDAYTGIQQAAAKTGQNVQDLIEINRFGFSSILLVGGLALIASGIPESKMKKEEKCEDPKTE